MLRPFFVAALLSLTGVLALAEISTIIVQDGSRVRCGETADLGHRAFKLRVLSVSASTLTLNLETLVCMKESEILQLVALPISAPFAQQLDNGIFTFEISQPELVLTNSEVTREILRIPLNGRLSSQQITVDRSSIFEKTVDLTIMGIGLTKKNDIIEDQAMTSGGHFRLINLN